MFNSSIIGDFPRTSRKGYEGKAEALAVTVEGIDEGETAREKKRRIRQLIVVSRDFCRAFRNFRRFGIYIIC